MERSDSGAIPDLAQPYEAALSRGVRIDRSPSVRLLRLTGPQRVWFLQNTITADVSGVPFGRWVESCFLDPKGRVVAFFRVGFLEDDIWIDADPSSGSQLADWFVKYKFRTKVEIEPVTTPSVTVIGPPAARIADEGAVARMGDAVAFGRTLAGVPVADVHGALDDDALVPAPPELHDALRIETGVGQFGVDFGPTDLPQEAGLTRVVSVEKGCYVGQETIARIHFRGHINRVLRTLAFTDVDPSTAPGRGLSWNGGSVGRITSAIDSPRSGPIGLGMVRVEPPEGAGLSVDGGGEAVVGPIPEGTKVKLPNA